MAGIYIHIPFCKKACHYCNFHFSTSGKLMPEMVAAICKEAALRKDYLQEKINTIYLGGGTPSLLSIQYLEQIFNAIKNNYTIAEDAEITLETNPDDINNETLRDWKSIGINRLSIGIQSFFEEDLEWMNRAHNATQAEKCITLAQENGFYNLTIDLIYGGPTLSDEHWKHNINKAIQLNIPHISCYALTVEPDTALDKMIEQHKKENVDTDNQARHFKILVKTLSDAGYEQYEISNFSKPGHRSKHNSAYWQQKKYIGLGPSAHSFNAAERSWNISNNALYIKSIEQNTLPQETEILTQNQRINEYIMTSLRTSEGLSLNYIQTIADEETANGIKQKAEIFVTQQKALFINNKIILTDEGKLFADGIASDLFLESQ